MRYKSQVLKRFTEKSSLPVYQDAFKTLTLHVLEVNLNLPEHEVVRFGVSVTQGQDLLEAGLVEDVEDVEQPLVHLGQERRVVQQPRVRYFQIFQEW